MLRKFKILVIIVVLVCWGSVVFGRSLEFKTYHYTKGYLELYKGNFKDAARDLWLVFPYIVNADFYNQLSDVLVYNNEYEKAQKVLQRAIKEYPNDEEFYYKLFDIYTMEGKTKEAEKIMVEIDKKFVHTVQAIKKLALMYLNSGDYGKSYNLLRKYLSKVKNDASAYFYLADVCLKKGNIKCALKEAREAYELNPNNFRYIFFIAVLYDRIGNFKNAIFFYRKLPESAFVDYSIGNDYYMLGDLENAWKFYLKAFSLARRIDYFEKLAFVGDQIGKYKDVSDMCGKYKDLVKQSDKLKLFCSISFAKRGKCNVAVKLLDKINKKVSFYKDVILNRIYCYYKDGNFKKVKRLLNKYGDTQMYFEVVSELYVKDKRFLEGIRLLEEALKKTVNISDRSNIYLYIANIYYEDLKNKDKTIEVLKRLLKLNPHYADGLNYLGYLYIDNNINVREGIKLVKEALKIKRDNPYYLDSLGWGYYKIGEYKKAEKYLKMAIERYKKDEKNSLEVSLEHLLSVYEKEKRSEDARKVAERILKLDPNNKRAKEFLNKE